MAENEGGAGGYGKPAVVVIGLVVCVLLLVRYNYIPIPSWSFASSQSSADPQGVGTAAATSPEVRGSGRVRTARNAVRPLIKQNASTALSVRVTICQDNRGRLKGLGIGAPDTCTDNVACDVVRGADGRQLYPTQTLTHRADYYKSGSDKIYFNEGRANIPDR